MRFVGPRTADGRLVVDIIVGGPGSSIPAYAAGRIGHRLKAQIGRRQGCFEGRLSLPAGASSLFFLRVVERVEQVAKCTVVVRSLAHRMVSLRYDQFYRSHARFDAKGRVHIGNQPLARNEQPIYLSTRSMRSATQRRTRPTRSRSRRHDASLPIEQHHSSALTRRSHHHPVDIHPRPDGLPRRIRSVPSSRMKASRLFPIYQRRNVLPQDIEHLQSHLGRDWQLVWDNRRGIERIGIIRSQGEAFRQDVAR